MNQIESYINSLRAMELPKGAESLLGNILSEAKTGIEEIDKLKKSLDKREADNKTERDRVKSLEADLKTAQDAAPDSEELKTYQALGKPDDLKTRLEQADRDRRSVIETGNKTALAKLGLKPGVVRLREFDGVSIAVEGSGDDLKATVKEGESEMTWGEWVKSKDLESDLKDFGLEPAEPDSVPALGQVGSGEKPKPKTQQEREGELRKEISI